MDDVVIGCKHDEGNFEQIRPRFNLRGCLKLVILQVWRVLQLRYNQP